MSLKIAENVVASIHYKLTNDNGDVLDDSEGSDPLRYLHGAGNIIPGLEKALLGKETGEQLKVSIAPEEAYGQAREELVQAVEKSAFEGVDVIEVGMNFEAQAPDGRVQPVVVKAVNDDTVTIDANHPLAGMTLHFDVTVHDVREATPEEIDHGHVH